VYECRWSGDGVVRRPICVCEVRFLFLEQTTAPKLFHKVEETSRSYEEGTTASCRLLLLRNKIFVAVLSTSPSPSPSSTTHNSYTHTQPPTNSSHHYYKPFPQLPAVAWSSQKHLRSPTSSLPARKHLPLPFTALSPTLALAPLILSSHLRSTQGFLFFVPRRPELLHSNITTP
jgi:hypothetical protein